MALQAQYLGSTSSASQEAGVTLNPSQSSLKILSQMHSVMAGLTITVNLERTKLAQWTSFRKFTAFLPETSLLYTQAYAPLALQQNCDRQSHLAVNPVIYNNQPRKLCPVMSQWYQCFESNQPLSDSIKAHSIWWTLCLVLLTGPKTHDYIGHGFQKKTHYYYFAKWIIINCILYTH